jgi:hypothetical protein
MEQYAEWMLILFHSYRRREDLLPLQPWTDFPFVMKLWELNAEDHIHDSNSDCKVILTAETFPSYRTFKTARITAFDTNLAQMTCSP